VTAPEEAAFRRIARAVLEVPGVTEGTGFGSNPGLRFKAKIFAMLGSGHLIVKLPKERVDGLIEAGAAKRFDPRRDGRVMKEWATVPVDRRREWNKLVDEALQFAKSKPSRSR
jgi:hypothetical protein